MADALKRAAAIAGKNDFQPSEATLNPAPSIKHGVSLSTSGAAAAAAPAKENPLEDVLPSLGAVRPAPAKTRTSSGGNKAGLIAAVVLLVVAAGGYFGWTKFHLSLQSIPFLKPAAPQVTKPAAPPAPAPSAAPIASAPAISAPAQPSAEVVATPLPSVPDKPATPTETVASTARKPTTIAVQNSAEPAAEPVKVIGDNNDAIVVSNEAPKAVAPKPAPQEVAEPAAPALNVASDTSDKAISGLVETPATVPHAAAQTLKVSQGVSQGLLVKKVPPVYPPQAVQMRIQGAVQMQATISKEGSISSVKVVSGDAVLARAAIDAVKEWKYKPYYLDGQPVEIQTQITVNFSLP
jgi:protein TonB